MSASIVLPSTDAAPDIVDRVVVVSLRSRLLLWLMRIAFKPMLARMMAMKPAAIAKVQLRCASMDCPDTQGLALDYSVVGGSVPGHVLGSLDVCRPVVLWLHGGAFILPAAPTVHLVMVAKLCGELGAAGFVPDYRLAPFNRFPAALDDCERAYRALLDTGYPPSQIVLGGDSAGGNLLFGVLQRIRKHQLPMPACAVALSPVTEMGRVHGPPARYRRMRQDPLLPIAAMQRIDELYAGDWDASDPELSPLYMDCAGMPPTMFLASDNEILADDTRLLARRFREAGVATTCHVWPTFPHAFPLFEPYFPEVEPARRDIVRFMRGHLN